MTIGTKPPAEVTIDLPLVRALIEEQHNDLAHLPLTDIGEGWDNRLFRLGDDLAVRVPRRAISAALIEQEQRWLPQLAPQLPLPNCRHAQRAHQLIALRAGTRISRNAALNDESNPAV